MGKILIVDDVEDNIRLLEHYLKKDGHSVLSAMSGAEGIAIAINEIPDLILLDIVMPGENGIEAIRIIKAHPTIQHIPVIMFSAEDGDQSVIEALDLGAHDYVTKPLKYPVLSARIRSALRLKESQDQLAEANQALAKVNQELEKMATTDSLTQLCNRRQFFALANIEFSKARRFKQPLTLIMLDADKFKLLNDTYGHAMGDEALIALADICRTNCRSGDIVGRMGGEELAICCPQTELKGAIGLAERIRQQIEDRPIVCQGQITHLTISVGVTLLTTEDKEINDALNRADKHLYRAKGHGRNQIFGDQYL